MLLYILDESYEYGCEFYGAAPAIGLTPLTERCFLSMSHAITQCKGASLCGASGVGKTETVKVTDMYAKRTKNSSTDFIVQLQIRGLKVATIWCLKQKIFQIKIRFGKTDNL